MSYSTVPRFIALVGRSGSPFTYIRDFSLEDCPCRTAQGFRDDLWHKTDNGEPLVITPTAGGLTGTFEYRVQFGYPQGQKAAISHFTGEQVSKRFTLTWTAPMVRPPAGIAKANSIRIFRRRTNLANQPWKLVVVISNMHTDEFEDNEADDIYTDANPEPIAEVCNDAGFLKNAETAVTYSVKGFIQPVQSGAVRRLVAEVATEMFGEFEEDDHIGLVPCRWKGHNLDFSNWSETGTDRITYNGRSYTVVAYNLIPDPADGNPYHHWEIGLRMVKE